MFVDLPIIPKEEVEQLKICLQKAAREGKRWREVH